MSGSFGKFTYFNEKANIQPKNRELVREFLELCEDSLDRAGLMGRREREELIMNLNRTFYQEVSKHLNEEEESSIENSLFDYTTDMMSGGQ